jgi:predicted nucleotidyltransferase
MEEHDFEESRPMHRLRSVEGALLDLVPYGGLESPAGQIEWPDEMRMTTLGFEEASAGAVEVALDGDLPILVASAPGQAVLKLVAWDERPDARRRDAEDLSFLMRCYYDMVGEALYAKHIDVFEDDDFDIHLTSCRLLGRDMAALSSSNAELTTRLSRILKEQASDTAASRLLRAMGRASFGDQSARAGGLRALLRGFEEQTPSD